VALWHYDGNNVVRAEFVSSYGLRVNLLKKEWASRNALL